jgi:hypothetical protein
MNNMERFDNWFSNSVVLLVGTMVRALERSVVTFFDGLHNMSVHGAPALAGFSAAFAPLIAPVGLAMQTQASLVAYHGTSRPEAIVWAVVVELCGFAVWSQGMKIFQRDGWRGTLVQLILSAGILGYEVTVFSINVTMAVKAGESTDWIIVMALLCLFPAFAAIAFGVYQHEAKAELERERREQAELAERIRQERRQDRKEAQAMKAQYASDAKGAELERPFRRGSRRS